MKKITNIFLFVFAVTWLVKEIIFPLSAAAIYSTKFMDLAYKCDTAMEASWFYRQNEKFDKRAELIQMVDCHEYDKTRKTMLFAGLNENYLSWLGLKSLELNQRSAEDFVKQHRFKER